MQSTKTPAAKMAERKKLRRELLRRIVRSEARRRDARAGASK